MLLVKLAKFLAAAAAIALANLVIFMGFLLAVFGRLDFFYGGVGLLTLVVCGLTLRTVFLRRENHLGTAFEFVGYGLVTVLARFVVTDLALVASGVLVLAGLLTLVEILLAPRPGRQSPYQG
ncbi:MAG: hypothetical protein J0I20_02720 [Chloroflexi bacterium]|nr:hypothetical protein [Chloroflexota bacterium]OJV89320.1 MAG: hypothetical protein BGO39_35640 [Chloroflexi bacterium 54-19]